MNESIHILCIDDVQQHLNQWERIIKSDTSKNYQIKKDLNGENVLRILSENRECKIVFIDKNLGASNKDGIEVAKEIRDNYSDIFLVLVTAYGKKNDFGDEKTEEITDALKEGTIDYYIDKENVFGELHVAIEKALESLNDPSKREEIKKERINSFKLLKGYKVEDNLDKIISKKLIGKSKTIKNLKKWIVKFAKTKEPIPVLIIGETGTGKEVVANLIHELSSRANNILRPVNCAAIPEELIESELFGHVKGAFTGANFNKKGQFELADGGTLFLDEISDIPLIAQTKILRVIQEKKIDKIGGQYRKVKKGHENHNAESDKQELDIPVDVRIICAANHSLLDKVKSNPPQFRPDLYYRLSGFHLKINPLRERKEDIPDLIEYFIGRIDDSATIHKYFTPKSIEILKDEYEWYGNVRELKSFTDNLVNLFPEKIPFDVESVREALELWRGMHPNTNYLFSENDSDNIKSGRFSKSVSKVNLNESKYKDALWVIKMLNNACAKTIDAASDKNSAYKRIEEVSENIKEKQLARIKIDVNAGKFDNLSVIGLFCRSKTGQEGMAFEGVYDYITTEFFELYDSEDKEVLNKLGDISSLKIKLSKTLEKQRIRVNKKHGN